VRPGPTHPQTLRCDVYKPLKALLSRLRWFPVHDLRWADGTVFMTRYTLFKWDGGYCVWKKFFSDGVHGFYIPAFSLKVHRFRRDDETVHDHPWKFISVIIWRNYVEEQWSVDRSDSRYLSLANKVKRRWLSLDWHHAEHSHRVLVEEGKDCWTLCFTWGRERVWGFWEDPDGIGRLRRWVDNVTHGEETGRHRVTY
jgi:hypothetical protein